MLSLKENIECYYNKVDPVDPLDPEIAFNNIAKVTFFELLDNGLDIRDIDKIMVKILQKNNRIKLKDYIIYKDGQPKCKICETKSNLEMHHIKPKSSRPELEYDIDNIVFLCDRCHKLLHGDFENAKAVNRDLKNKIKQIFKEKLNKNLGNELFMKLASK